MIHWQRSWGNLRNPETIENAVALGRNEAVKTTQGTTVSNAATQEDRQGGTEVCEAMAVMDGQQPEEDDRAGVHLERPFGVGINPRGREVQRKALLL